MLIFLVCLLLYSQTSEKFNRCSTVVQPSTNRRKTVEKPFFNRLTTRKILNFGCSTDWLSQQLSTAKTGFRVKLRLFND